MRFALLGTDPDAISLGCAVARDPRHSLVWIDAGVPSSDLVDVASAARRDGAWETLLTGSVADAVIVGRGPDGEVRADQLRKLVQAGIPLLVTHPVIDSMLVYYELEMIREESGCRILPFLPARWHPAFERLIEVVDAWEEVGGQPVEQVVFERTLADGSRETVLNQFARDADLARVLCGELTKVGALGSPTPSARFANLAVQLSGPEGPPIRWSVSPADDSSGGRLTVTSTAGKALLSMPDGGLPWSLERTAAGQPAKETFADFDPAAAALGKLEDLIAGGEVEPGWLDAARTIELAEGVERSLLKGRTIEIHRDEQGEQGAFRGTMTSVGCGLLMISLLVVLAAALASGLGFQQFGFWPYLLLGVLGVFLLMQLLQLVIPREG
jgi:myo-inositol 2-dehydrogenase/D-chiro-inositol 1-dehydrogenase